MSQHAIQRITVLGRPDRLVKSMLDVVVTRIASPSLRFSAQRQDDKLFEQVLRFFATLRGDD